MLAQVLPNFNRSIDKVRGKCLNSCHFDGQYIKSETLSCILLTRKCGSQLKG